MSLNVDDFLSTVDEGERKEEENQEEGYLSGGEEFLSTCESDVKVDFLSTVDEQEYKQMMMENEKNKKVNVKKKQCFEVFRYQSIQR